MKYIYWCEYVRIRENEVGERYIFSSILYPVIIEEKNINTEKKYIEIVKKGLLNITKKELELESYLTEKELNIIYNDIYNKWKDIDNSKEQIKSFNSLSINTNQHKVLSYTYRNDYDTRYYYIIKKPIEIFKSNKSIESNLSIKKLDWTKYNYMPVGFPDYNIIEESPLRIKDAYFVLYYDEKPPYDYPELAEPEGREFSIGTYGAASKDLKSLLLSEKKLYRKKGEELFTFFTKDMQEYDKDINLLRHHKNDEYDKIIKGDLNKVGRDIFYSTHSNGYNRYTRIKVIPVITLPN